MLEALSLGRLVEQSGKRMIGVSDGFDSAASMSKIQLAMFAALQEMFIDQLRSGVNRGMDDAFRQGTNTGLPAIGYKLAPAVNAEGKQMFGKDSDRLNMLVVGRRMARYVKLAFRLFAEKGWTMSRIARRFNEKRVGGMESWDSGRIRRHEVCIKELNGQIRGAESRNDVPPPLDKAAVEAIVSDLRGLWQQDVSAIAPLLRELTGPVTVRVEQEEGNRHPTWFAEFTLDFVPVIAKLTAKRNCPTARTWEYLNRTWEPRKTQLPITAGVSAIPRV